MKARIFELRLGGAFMVLPLKVVGPDGREATEPYTLRVAGWTEERYFAEAPETRVVEFEDGEIIVHSPVTMRHQEIVGFLTFILRGYVETRGVGRVFNGPAVVQLRPGLDYEPDIFFVATAQLEGLREHCFAGAPGLIVEVVSPASRVHDLKRKVFAYREHGVPEYWAVDPDYRLLTCHLLPEDRSGSYQVFRCEEGRLESRVLSGFWLEVAWLWCDPLPTGPECLRRILGT